MGPCCIQRPDPGEGLETQTRWFTGPILLLFATQSSTHPVRHPTEQDAFVCPNPLISLEMGLRRKGLG